MLPDAGPDKRSDQPEDSSAAAYSFSASSCPRNRKVAIGSFHRIFRGAIFLNPIKHLREYAWKVVEMTWFSCVDDYFSDTPPFLISATAIDTGRVPV